MTYNDVKCKIKLHTGEQQAKVVQDFQSFMEVVKIAFGAPEKEKAPEAKSTEAVKAGFRSVFG